MLSLNLFRVVHGSKLNSVFKKCSVWGRSIPVSADLLKDICLVSSIILLVIVDFCFLHWLRKEKHIFSHLSDLSDKRMRKRQFTH